MTDDRIIVYTCVSKNYDRALMPVPASDAVRFVCFTDSPAYLRAPGWEVRAVESPERLQSGHDINRYHKFFPHRLFPDARWSIYLDGNLRYAGDWRALVDRVAAAGAGLGAFWHPEGHSLAQEIEACRRLKFDARDTACVDRQIALYVGDGARLDAPIPTNNLLVRDHAFPGLADAMSLWWSHLFEFSKRDQISLLHALAQRSVPWQPLDGDGGVDPALVSVIWHRPPLLARIRKRLRRMFG
ncbi:glycosyltransferase domain-containing protein [Sphingomonas hengshuiensis]|uniref:TOD1/MUCI70 glycosyltransferase-like domain-containing protein n=1 Tax=Sphingomonas hengshuiensis TaxID=1609977 RepID=A0A7U4LGU9_9SPHN|nr:glycosyltransferase domain-containing protein [Sphingomonas hengshuiensis]AJP73895.1 hypothetical protein TS85_21975 [Sphingomonas hengshuiensis]